MAKKLLEYQVEWEKLVEQGNSKYNTLTHAQRVWLNVGSLHALACNGGLASFFVNTKEERYKETIDNLRTLRLAPIAAIVEEVSSLFPEKAQPNNIRERSNLWTAIHSENEEEAWFLTLLDTFDQRYFAQSQQLEAKLLRHIARKVFPPTKIKDKIQTYMRENPLAYGLLAIPILLLWALF